jgi:hypothetical protein
MLQQQRAEGATRPRGGVALQINGRGPGLAWKLRNFAHWWRGWWKLQVAQILDLAYIHGEVRLQVLKASGEIIDFGVVSHRLVTTAYVTAVATYQFDGSGPLLTAYDHHDIGTGTNAEAAGDTTLQTPYGGSRATGTPTNPGAGQYRTTGTITVASSFAITEHGVFSASSAGTLLDRSVFAAVNLTSGDSLQAQYTLTYSSGG